MLFGIKNIETLELIYSVKKEFLKENVILAKSLDHTMFESLDKYVKQKLPCKDIKQAIIQKKKIEIHGIYPSHYVENPDIFRTATRLNKISFSHNDSSKKFNFIRPEFYENKDSFVAFIPCGKDYLQHYSSLLIYFLDTLTTRWSDYTTIFRYPYAENSIHIWSQLDSNFIKEGDRVIIGYVEELEKYITEMYPDLIVETFENKFYKSTRIISKNINFLGVKYSFWGNMSAKLVNRFCNLGASEIIYFGKLGTLESPNCIYNKIYSPTSYSVVYHDKIVSIIDDLPNQLSVFLPPTGMHTSVPTIMEEDYLQRDLLDILKSESMDNEISQIAYTIKKFNLDNQKQVKYSCCHFATDYIRQLENQNEITEYDLSNNRTDSAKIKKAEIIAKISSIITNYLFQI